MKGPRLRLRTISRIAVLCAAAAVLSVVGWGLFLPAGPHSPALVTVEPGESASLVASRLVEKRLIPSADLFVAAAYVTGRWRRIQAGQFEVSPSMTPVQILEALCDSKRRAWRWLAVPEGYTLHQIAEAVQERGLASAQQFLDAASASAASDFPFLPPDGGLEGYLYPDTYRVDVGQSPERIVRQMLARFREAVWQRLFEEKLYYRGRSLRDLITLASLVEAEARHDKERAIIAGVLTNRLNRGIKLECDATVQYALGDGRKAKLTYQDLQISSPYNTYQHAGLPPGPICSPGEASIRAAMKPARVPYLYYVARADGSHVFSVTFSQHQGAKARIRNASSQQSGNH